jgi:hypothetical protein
MSACRLYAPASEPERIAMFAAYVAVAVATAGINVWAAWIDFVRAEFVLENGRELGLPDSWLPWLGVAKLLGGVGLLLGLVEPLRPIGIAAAVGLVLFFTGAVFIHIRERVLYKLQFPAVFLAFAVAALALGLAH